MPNVPNPDANTPLTPDEQEGLIPNLATHEELNEWERDNILRARQWALGDRQLTRLPAIISSRESVTLYQESIGISSYQKLGGRTVSNSAADSDDGGSLWPRSGHQRNCRAFGITLQRGSDVSESNIAIEKLETIQQL